MVENIDFRIRGFVDQFESAIDRAIGKIDSVSAATRRANKLLEQGFSEDTIRGLVSGLTRTTDETERAVSGALQFKRNLESAFKQIAAGNDSVAQIATRVGARGLNVVDVRSVETAFELTNSLVKNLEGFVEAGLGAEKIREELQRAGVSSELLQAALRKASGDAENITLEKFVETAKAANFTVSQILRQLGSANLTLFGRLENVLPGLQSQAAGDILKEVGLTGENLKGFTNEVAALENRTDRFLDVIRETGEVTQGEFLQDVSGPDDLRISIRALERATEEARAELQQFAKANDLNLNVGGLGAEAVRQARSALENLDVTSAEVAQNFEEKFGGAVKKVDVTIKSILSQLNSANLSLFDRLESVLPGLRGEAAGDILSQVGLTGENLKGFTSEVIAVENRTERFLDVIRTVGEVTVAEFTRGVNGPDDLRISVQALERATEQARRELEQLAKQGKIDINVSSLGAADVRRARGALEDLDSTSKAFRRNFEEEFGSAARVANRNSNRMEQAFDGAALSLFFFGLQLRSVSRTISRTAITTYNDVISRTTESATAVDRLNGAFQFLQFAIGQALLPVIQFLTPIIVRVAEWVSENENLVASLIVIAGVAGTALTVVTSLRLAFLSAGEVAGRFASGAADSAGFFAGTVVPKFKKGTDRYKKNVNGFRKSGEKNLSSLQRAFRRFGDEGVLLAETTGSFFGDIRKAGRGAFGRLTSSITGFVSTASASISSFTKNSLSKFGSALTGFVKNPLASLRSGLGSLASFLTGGLKAAFSAVFSPAGIIVVVIAAVVALAVALSQNQELLDSLKKNILGPIQRAFGRLAEAFGFAGGEGSGFKDVLNILLSVLSVVGAVIAALAGFLVTVFAENLAFVATVVDVALIQPFLVVVDVIRAVIAALSGDFTRAGDLIFGVGSRIKNVFSDVAAIPGQIGESFGNIKDSVSGGFSFITDTVSTLQEEGGFLGLFEGDSTTSSEANIDVQTKGSERQVREQRVQQDLQRETNRKLDGVANELRMSRQPNMTRRQDPFSTALSEADRVA